MTGGRGRVWRDWVWRVLPAMRHLPCRGPRHGDHAEGAEGLLQALWQRGPGLHHHGDSSRAHLYVKHKICSTSNATIIYLISHSAELLGPLSDEDLDGIVAELDEVNLISKHGRTFSVPPNGNTMYHKQDWVMTSNIICISILIQFMISGWFWNNGLWRILWDDDDLTQLVFDLKNLRMMQNKWEQINV